MLPALQRPWPRVPIVMSHAQAQGWRVELLSASESELGGYKEAVLRIAGEEHVPLMPPPGI